MPSSTRVDDDHSSLTSFSVLESAWPPPRASFQRPVSRHRISDAVFEHLSESIRNLALEPGTPISEPGVASWLEVSRSPVREAFTRLADMGLITVTPQVGSFIAPISITEVYEAVFIRSALETKAFQRAIQTGAPDTTEIQRLVDANRVAAHEQNLEEFFATDEQLHQSVFVLAGMPRLWDVVRGTKMQLDRLRRLSLPLSILNPDLVVEHQRIVDSLRTRDEAGGVAVIEKHAARVLLTIDEMKTANPKYFTP